MAEDNISQLEQKRFVINSESMQGLKDMRHVFTQLQQQYPWLSGLGFFGSRTKGQERSNSDFDTVVFYNSDRIHNIPDGTPAQWADIFAILRGNNRNLDSHLLNSNELRVNISQERTDHQLEMFKEVTASLLNQEVDDDTLIDKVNVPPTENLVLRFFMAVGDEVYQSRRYILEKLKADPNGEKYFQVLIKYLAWFERESKDPVRPAISYKRYPQSIEEAEQFFLTKVGSNQL